MGKKDSNRTIARGKITLTRRDLNKPFKCTCGSSVRTKGVSSLPAKCKSCSREYTVIIK